MEDPRKTRSILDYGLEKLKAIENIIVKCLALLCATAIVITIFIAHYSDPECYCDDLIQPQDENVSPKVKLPDIPIKKAIAQMCAPCNTTCKDACIVINATSFVCRTAKFSESACIELQLTALNKAGISSDVVESCIFEKTLKGIYLTVGEKYKDIIAVRCLGEENGIPKEIVPENQEG